MGRDGLDIWRWFRRPTLEEWVCLHNIRTFEQQILEETSEDRKTLLKRLLDEEHRKLRAADQAGL